MGMEKRGHDEQVATEADSYILKRWMKPIAFPGHEAHETASTAGSMCTHFHKYRSKVDFRLCARMNPCIGVAGRGISPTPPVRSLYPVPIHPQLRPRRPWMSLNCGALSLLWMIVLKARAARWFVSAVFVVYFPPWPLAGALISHPRLPFIFSLVFSPSPFRTISSGTCPPEVNLPCTCRCLVPPLPSPSRPTAAPPRRAIVLLNSICFLISLSHSFSVTRPEKGERAEDGVCLREEARKADSHLYFLGGLVGVWRLSGEK